MYCDNCLYMISQYSCVVMCIMYYDSQLSQYSSQEGREERERGEMWWVLGFMGGWVAVGLELSSLFVFRG